MKIEIYIDTGIGLDLMRFMASMQNCVCSLEISTFR